MSRYCGAGVRVTMAFQFSIDKEKGILRETWIGPVDLAGLKDSCLQEWRHPDYRRGMPMISDFRQARAALSAGDALQFALWFGDKDPPKKLAIVVSRESRSGVAQMFALMSGAAGASAAASTNTSDTQVFYSYDDAEAWLLGIAKS